MKDQTFDKASLAVWEACAKDKMRYATSSVQIAPNRTVATDGRILAVVTSNLDGCDRSEFTPFLMPAESVKDLAKCISGRGNPGVTELDAEETEANGHAKFRHAGGSVVATKDEGTFPDVDAVIPTGEPTFSVAFNPSMLARLVKIARACDGASPKDQTIRLDFFGSIDPCSKGTRAANSPIRVTTSKSSRFTGVLMPICID